MYNANIDMILTHKYFKQLFQTIRYDLMINSDFYIFKCIKTLILKWLIFIVFSAPKLMDKLRDNGKSLKHLKHFCGLKKCGFLWINMLGCSVLDPTVSLNHCVLDHETSLYSFADRWADNYWQHGN